MKLNLVPVDLPVRFGLSAVLVAAVLAAGHGQAPSKSTPMKEEIRQPWTRSDERFIRGVWQILGEFPTGAAEALGQDPFAGHGGESSLRPDGAVALKREDGSAYEWRSVSSWADAIDLSDGMGLKRDLVAYAATTIRRDEAGPVLLCLGSDEGMRAWVNGVLVLEADGPRPLSFDEDRVEVRLDAGDNLLLVKVEQHTGPWRFAARVLASGAVPTRVEEIEPAFAVEAPTTLIVRTDLDRSRIAEDGVTILAIAAGGRIFAEMTAPRGETLRIDAANWPDGAYELRFSTTRPDGRRYSTHRAWFKGDAIVAARELVEAGAAADEHTPVGQTIKMLADMVLDRLGEDGLAVSGNPWWAIHSPLMEYAELKLEAAGEPDARARAGGFFRLAWRDEVDDSPQFARVFLPVGYDPTRKTPLVLRLHGYNPPNPEYIRWWGVDERHNMADVQYGRGEDLIYMEPHGRGNAQYLSLGDRDVLRAIAEAGKRFNVDEDRVYLCGDSMGGWGTWNVGTRHPDVFAALGPIHGGFDYHSHLTGEDLAGLDPLKRFILERESSLAQADGLNNLPVMVLHGDEDRSVDVEGSRYLVQVLQRWRYDVRYLEFPGYGHENLSSWPVLFDWFLKHRRNDQPRQVRLRSAELLNASAYWVTIDLFDRPDLFMEVDAAIVDGRTIRVDSRNVLALSLSPGAPLINPSEPVTVVWNGIPLATRIEEGRIRLRSPGLTAPVPADGDRMGNWIGDIFRLPFAIVVGTESADPGMNEVIRRKADALVTWWRAEHHHTPRVFEDSEITTDEESRYSLILIGGAESNRVTRKMAGDLPLTVSDHGIAIGGHRFAVSDGWVEMIYPNPLNPQRQVLVVAATSAAGLQVWFPEKIWGTPFGFVVEDGRIASVGQQAVQSDLMVGGGWFDRGWGVDELLIYDGSSEARSRAWSLSLSDPAEDLDGYVGRYRIAPGLVAQVTRTDDILSIQMGDDPTAGFLSLGDGRFYSPGESVRIRFEKDTAGRVVGFAAEGFDGLFVGQRLSSD